MTYSTVNNTAIDVTAAGAATATSSASKVYANDVALHFVKEFYTMLSRDPAHLHCFYSKHSTLLHSREEDQEAPVCVGLDEINQRVLSMNFTGSRVIISNVDCQPSMNGGIQLLVIGQMHMASKEVRRFVQSFFLAEQPNGFYILNDILRFLDDKVTAAVTAPATTTTAAAAAPVKKEVVAPVKKEVAVPEVKPTQVPEPAVSKVPESVAASSAREVPDVAAKKHFTEEMGTWGQQSPVKAAPAPTAPVAAAAAKPEESKAVRYETSKKRHEQKPVAAAVQKEAEESTPSQGSSWASLASAQKSKWGSGMVASAKGPVVSVPIAEKPQEKRIQNNANRNTRPVNNNNKNGDATSPKPAAAAARSPRQNNNYDANKSLYVSEIAVPIERDAIRALFATHGTLVSFECIPSRAIAFVEFETETSAQSALAQPPQWRDQAMKVEKRRPPKPNNHGNNSNFNGNSNNNNNRPPRRTNN